MQIEPIPATMKAFVLDRYASGTPLRLAQLPTPRPQDDEVLVRVHAAGLNPLDVKIRDGAFKRILPYRLPRVLGHDVAGEVVQVGARVRRWRVGDAVYACADTSHIGTLAEFVTLHESSVAPKPARLSMAEAAAMPLVSLTAWQALVVRGGLQAGQSVFIQAGAGGVGSVAIQLAKHLGATVATTAGTASLGLVKSLGADVAIDYRKQDFAQLLRDVDLVLHSQDQAALLKSLQLLRPGGRLVSLSGPPDPDFARQRGATLPLQWVMRLLSAGVRRRARRLGVHYGFLFMTANGSQLEDIGRLIDAGTLRPVVDRVLPFESANEALELVAAGRTRGKVVVALR